MHASPFTLAVVLALAAPAGAAEFMIRQRTTQGGLPDLTPQPESTQYYSGATMITENVNVRAIVDMSAGTFTLIDTSKHTYYVAPLDALRQQSAQAEKTAADVPPGARRRYGLDAPVTVTPTGKTARLADTPAREFTLVGGPARARVWIAEGLDLPPAAREWQQLSAPLRGQVRPGANLAAEVSRLGGLPLRTVFTVKLGKGRSFKSTSEVTLVVQGPPPPELRAIPDGFTKVDAPVFQN